MPRLERFQSDIQSALCVEQTIEHQYESTSSQNIKRVTVSVTKFAHEISGSRQVTIEVCPLQVDLQFRSIIANFDNRAFHLSNRTPEFLPEFRARGVYS